MSRKLFAVLVLVAVLFVAITGDVAYADGPGNGKGQGKANGHVKQEERKAADDGGSSNNSGGGSSESPSNSGGSSSESSGSDSGGAGSPSGSSDSGSSGGSESTGPKGNGNTGASWTRKGLDDPKQDQNIYQSGDTLSYHVSNRHPGENTIIVKEPGHNGEIVFQTTVMVGEDGTLDVVLTEIPESWSGVYQVQIWDEKGMKNDNINIKRKHLVNPEDLPGNEEPEDSDDTPESEEPGSEDSGDVPESEGSDTPGEPADQSSEVKKDEGDCITVVYHASSPLVTVVEFFRPEHAAEPWLHEDEILGESRVDTEGAVVARYATGVVFVVFEYDEVTGGYNYRGTGEVIGNYERPIDIWSDGDASSVFFGALIWTPVGAK